MNTDDWMIDGRTTPPAESTAFYLPEAADCLSCGLCVSTCPTYQVNPIYEESPRGRVRILDKLLNQRQSLSDSERSHLQHCTLCRACETVCPSRMSYGQAFDAAQHQLAPKSRPWLAWLGFQLIAQKACMQFAAVGMGLYQNSGLHMLTRRFGVLHWLKLDKAEALAPAVSVRPLANKYPAAGQHLGSVALFTGCLAAAFDRQTLDDAIKVLSCIGFDVLVPKAQRCCGAIHLHQGEAKTAQQMMEDNWAVFNGLEVEAIIYTASGCGLMLSEYPQTWQKPLLDICDFVNQHWNGHLSIKPVRQTVAVHEPCSQRNGVKNQQAVYDLLGKIPGLTVLPLPENSLCCGAGGVNTVIYPELAEPLRKRKQKQFADTEADCLVTANIGCALHVRVGLNQTLVAHPISLLADGLSKAPAQLRL